jgi:hypothetical protein
MPCAYQDTEGVIVLNIASYMGGVDLWQNDHDHDDDFSSQSMHDKMLEVVCISGTWHLGKLQVKIICMRNTLLTYSVFSFSEQLLLLLLYTAISLSMISGSTHIYNCFLWFIGRTIKSTSASPRESYKISPAQFIPCSG